MAFPEHILQILFTMDRYVALSAPQPIQIVLWTTLQWTFSDIKQPVFTCYHLLVVVSKHYSITNKVGICAKIASAWERLRRSKYATEVAVVLQNITQSRGRIVHKLGETGLVAAEHSRRGVGSRYQTFSQRSIDVVSVVPGSPGASQYADGVQGMITHYVNGFARLNPFPYCVALPLRTGEKHRQRQTPGNDDDILPSGFIASS